MEKIVAIMIAVKRQAILEIDQLPLTPNAHHKQNVCMRVGQLVKWISRLARGVHTGRLNREDTYGVQGIHNPNTNENRIS
jgi:hypothetical protein